MRVHIGTDHAGFETKNAIVEALRAKGYEVVDHGAHALDSQDDYPDFIIPTAQAVVADPGSLGVVLGGSGNGEVIAANKVPGIRAAVVYTLETASLARQHNDANVASLGARMQPEDVQIAIIETFLTTPFSGDSRHVRRIGLITAYEESR
ncbi:MAG: ribose-5-phosphate isomerase [Propionibacteriaceae bacterium]|jgi:ribose 5-phosphate isomerase B|nr:ribose-5-phosphate isomerase [Propionibacteriaceae bacterium]